MTNKQFLETDATTRIIYAFNYFTSINPSWEEESSSNVKNRKIGELLGITLDDAYFILDNRFYSFNYEKVDDDNIACELKEYDGFYDFAHQITIIRFNFSCKFQDIKLEEETVQRVDKCQKTVN